MNKVSELLTERVNHLSTIMENDLPKWRKLWSISEKNKLTQKRYSLNNTLFLAGQNEGKAEKRGNEWLTFKQAQDLGLRIKKGAKGSYIFFFKMLEKRDNPKELFPYLTYSSVFNYLRDVEGAEETIITNIQAEELLNKILANYTIPVKLGNCAYNPKDDVLYMPELAHFGENINDYYSSFFHELIHSTGKRLGRVLITDHQTDDYAYEELIAEIGSNVLCNLCGIENTVNSDSYIQGWAKRIKENTKTLWNAAKQAEQAVNLLIGQTE